MKKKVLILLLLTAYAWSGHSQSESKFSVEFNVLRVGNNFGLHKDFAYKYGTSFVSGVAVGFKKSSHWNYKFGIRRLPKKVSRGVGYSHEITTIKGNELFIGVEYVKSEERLFFFSYQLNLIYENSAHSGEFLTDYPLPNEVLINNRKQFYAIGPSINLNFRFPDNINVVLGTRLKLGFTNINKLSDSVNYYLHDTSYFLMDFEPISNLTVKVKI